MDRPLVYLVYRVYLVDLVDLDRHDASGRDPSWQDSAEHVPSCFDRAYLDRLFLDSLTPRRLNRSFEPRR